MPRRDTLINFITITSVALVVVNNLWVYPAPSTPGTIEDDSDSAIVQLAASLNAARQVKSGESAWHLLSVALSNRPAYAYLPQFLFEAQKNWRKESGSRSYAKNYIRAPPEGSMVGFYPFVYQLNS